MTDDYDGSVMTQQCVSCEAFLASQFTRCPICRSDQIVTVCVRCQHAEDDHDLRAMDGCDGCHLCPPKPTTDLSWSYDDLGVA